MANSCEESCSEANVARARERLGEGWSSDRNPFTRTQVAIDALNGYDYGGGRRKPQSVDVVSLVADMTPAGFEFPKGCRLVAFGDTAEVADLIRSVAEGKSRN